MLNFTAIDFETANSSGASACSVGLVKVRDGVVIDKIYWLIKPPTGHDAFLSWNMKIHGIHPSDVIGADSWARQLPKLVAFAGGDTLVAHNASFDLGVIKTASTVTGQPIPNFSYLCSLQVARRTYHLDSYRLPLAAMAAGFDDFDHHNALADAEACAAIIIHSAARHEAATLEQLAHITRVKMGAIGPIAIRERAATHGPMALN
ncbi:DNA polymerase III subunit epsilon [Cryobacterium roopkundense]|uniref:DNA polymerase III subunit epsilon n=1 Tax=Cryobacterium roopkundense TaxID=1001240 RepID=A0A099J3V4_9MICO|nr:exonuclease domain-containing protein [Cryobacterium roopkundense]KGJ72212.1 DNA polymerase III subunit epsilon [Cryobacterium roopkundense]MBB5641971.1 DNA polymerase-3 subunit epsilon [Cryobacterium roopkundense]